MPTIVPPVEKCRGCYHYNEALGPLGACTADRLPLDCGEGEDPETGYAPLIGDSQGYEEYMRKRGLHYLVERNTPPAPTSADESSENDVDYRVEIIGDSAIRLSEGEPDMQKSQWAIATAAWQKVSPAKRKKFVRAAMARHRAAGEDISAGKYARRAPREFMEHIAHKSLADLRFEFGNDVAKAMYSDEVLRDMADLNPESRLYKALAAKAKVEKPRPESGKAKAPGQQKGASAPAAHSALYRKTREAEMKRPHPDARTKANQHGGGSTFHHSRLSEKAGVPNDQVRKMALESHHADHFLQRVRGQFGDSVKDLSDGQIRSAYHSTGLRHSMSKTTNFKKGMEEDITTEAEKLAHKVVKTPGAVGRASSAGRKDVYRTLDNSARRPGKVTAKSVDCTLMEACDLLEKSEGAGKHNRCIGHTTTGKAIYADGCYYKGFTREDHEEAEEVHDRLANKLGSAASRWGDSALPVGSRKYLQALADHHRGMSWGHGRKARPVQSVATPSDTAIKIPSHFGLDEKMKKSLDSAAVGMNSPSAAFDLTTTKRMG